MMLWLKIAEPLLLGLGMALVLVGSWRYGRRKHDWLALPRIVFNRAKDLTLQEYRWLRYGGMLLFVGVLVRIASLTLYPA
ncbi:hypothetical protein PU634_05985 [Oceanimonas pelagia]|uniref:Uncharacterized protein n=1 Tax=Oceanimonas pelagia TaxID=3028314 RepID=A0AA50KRD1_9GAMM|nr:hypothetical protein [Oceanimonas pelagia]WMC11916.1 hypothetical protein PU634_05985 [Oceanimonas pelagia]